MLAKDLAVGLDEGFQSALNSIHGATLTRMEVSAILKACANNAAQALADRTVSEETANRFIVLQERIGVTIDLESWIKDELFESQREMTELHPKAMDEGGQP